ncbi:MAG: DUF1800 family protein, partial [Bryobacteraceae bacterium]
MRKHRLAVATGIVVVLVAIPVGAKLSPDDRVAHALDRLTFGARPGEVARVRAMGLKKWIDQQLHPERIAENPALEAKLQPLDTLRMGTRELVENYPPPQLLRAMAEGRAPLPSDPERRRVVEAMADRYKRRLEGNAARPSQPAPPDLRGILSPEQMRTLRNGTEEERKQVAVALSPEQREKLMAALPDGGRRMLYASATPEMRRRMLVNLNPQTVVSQDLTEAKLYRAILSHRQLAEVLADFWYN